MKRKHSTRSLIFSYVGNDRSGKKITGIVKAKNIALAKVTLYQQGIIIQKITKKRYYSFRARITSADITFFSRQLATLIESGIPLSQSLDTLIKGQSKESLKKLIAIIQHDIKTGLTLSEALREHPSYFNELVCSLIDTGEKSGTLDILLHKVASYREKIESIKKKTKSALAYPLMVVTTAFIVTTCLLIFVVPKFASLFESFGAEIPMTTQWLMHLSAFIYSYWYLDLGGLVVLGCTFIYAQQRFPAFAYHMALLFLKIPLIGPVIEKTAIARFCRTLAITFAASLPLVKALKSAAAATNNRIYIQTAAKIQNEITTGQQLSTAMQNTQRFPNMVIQMIAIGEESGALEKMLHKIADFYENEVDNFIESFSDLLEPVIMLILGILVGGLVIALYLPIFKLGSTM